MSIYFSLHLLNLCHEENFDNGVRTKRNIYICFVISLTCCCCILWKGFWSMQTQRITYMEFLCIRDLPLCLVRIHEINSKSWTTYSWFMPFNWNRWICFLYVSYAIPQWFLRDCLNCNILFTFRYGLIRYYVLLLLQHNGWSIRSSLFDCIYRNDFCFNSHNIVPLQWKWETIISINECSMI